jgi:hypothetical protein
MVLANLKTRSYDHLISVIVYGGKLISIDLIRELESSKTAKCVKKKKTLTALKKNGSMNLDMDTHFLNEDMDTY